MLDNKELLFDTLTCRYYWVDKKKVTDVQEKVKGFNSSIDISQIGVNELCELLGVGVTDEESELCELLGIGVTDEES